MHIPHSGTHIPPEYLGDYFLPEAELTANIYQYADLYTDELFGSFLDTFGGVKNPYSRLFVDPERFGDDGQEAMQKNFRLGWFYENAILEKKPLRSTANKSTIRKYFDDHHDELNRLTAQKLQDHGRCTVIDCHSFSDERYWFHDPNLRLPDICIGFEDAHVDGELVAVIRKAFEGYEIGVNVPYAGSLVPTDYWGRDTRVKSVMIEINKKLYLNPDNTTKSAGFERIKENLERIRSILEHGE